MLEYDADLEDDPAGIQEKVNCLSLLRYGFDEPAHQIDDRPFFLPGFLPPVVAAICIVPPIAYPCVHWREKILLTVGQKTCVTRSCHDDAQEMGRQIAVTKLNCCNLAKGNLSSIDQTLVALWWPGRAGYVGIAHGR